MNKKIIIFAILFCLIVCFFVGCSNEKEFQNQYLKIFELDFIDTIVSKTIDNEYGVYFEIELTDEEVEKFIKFAKERDNIFHIVDSDLYLSICKNVNMKTNLLDKNIQLLDEGYYSFYDYESNTYNSVYDKTNHFVFLEYSKGVVYLYRIR